MPKIAAMARSSQPGLLVVDRTVHGPYENYQTPEQRIPKEPLAYPWESCMTLANNWGFVPNDNFKSPAKVIHALIEIVAKGGSLLLGIGPKADGTLPVEATERLAAIGQWMKVNGEAIYNTRTVANYQQGNTWFVRSKDSATFYALTCIKEGETFPAVVEWKGNLPKKGTKMKLLQSGQTVKWVIEGDAVKVTLPAALLKTKTYYPALAFAYTPAS
jgi:alpha-L-fucosidase